MPYPNEHAARVKNPSLFKEDSFRRKTIDTGVTIIIGKLKDGDDSMVTQAYRFDIDYFTEAKAKKWLKDHDVDYISFEKASGKANNNNENKSENNEPEQRTIDSSNCTYKKEFDGDGNHTEYISGIGIIYNSETEIIPGVYELIRPGAFSKSLNRFRELKCFINHDPSQILSTTKSNPPLEITDNEESLNFRSPIPETTYGKDLAINVGMGNISGASFSFMINEGGDKLSMDDSGNYHREILSAEIYEIGPVTNPAYQQTTVSLRSRETLLTRLKKQALKNDQTLRIVNDFLFHRKGL